MSNGNDLLMSGGIPSAKFPTIGSTVQGYVLDEPDSMQQTDFDSGEPKWFDPEKTRPMMQVVVTIGTTERDSEHPDDDGTRKLYIKGATLVAARNAVKAAGDDGIHTGGYVIMSYTTDGPKPVRGNPPKVYSFQYIKAPSSGNQVIAAAAPAAPPAPAPTAPPAAPPVQQYATPPQAPPAPGVQQAQEALAAYANSPQAQAQRAAEANLPQAIQDALAAQRAANGGI